MNDLKDFIKAVFNQNDLGWLEGDINMIFALLGLLGVVAPFIWKLFKIINRVYYAKFAGDLSPYFSKIEVKNAVNNYIPTKCQNIPPSLGAEPGDNHAFITKEKLIPFFVKQIFNSSEDKFYFVLADSGMGKTTFMINLFISIKKRYWLLRFLKLMSSTNVFLLPLGHPGTLDEIREIDDSIKSKSILLLDAFDEDIEAAKNYHNRLNIILKEVWEFEKVIITCRTQFFPNQKEEPYQTGVMKFGGQKGTHVFGKIYVSPFDKKDINNYLSKKFSLFQFEKKKRANRIMSHASNLTVRPMLLSHIESLIVEMEFDDYSHKFPTYKVYESLINKWLLRESSRQGVNADKFRKSLFEFSKNIAVHMYHKRIENNGLYLLKDEIETFSKEKDIQLDSIDMRSRSLMNRTADGRYKFSHKSILEYFLALNLMDDSSLKNSFKFEGMDMVKMFYVQMSEAIYLKPFKDKHIPWIDWFNSEFGYGTVFLYYTDWKEDFNEEEFLKAVPNMTFRSTQWVKEEIPKYIRNHDLIISRKKSKLYNIYNRIKSKINNEYYKDIEYYKDQNKSLEDHMSWIEFITPILEKNGRLK